MLDKNIEKIYLKVNDTNILHNINKYINFEKVNKNLFLIN